VVDAPLVHIMNTYIVIVELLQYSSSLKGETSHNDLLFVLLEYAKRVTPSFTSSNS